MPTNRNDPGSGVVTTFPVVVCVEKFSSVVVPSRFTLTVTANPSVVSVVSARIVPVPSENMLNAKALPEVAVPLGEVRGSDLADCYQSIGDSRLAFGEGTKALESYRQAIDIRERLYAKDGRNADVRADLASSYAQFGQAYAMLASSTKAQDPGREERWREACSAYEKSLALLSEEPNREVNDSWGNSERDIAVRGRAKCDSALLKLHEKR